MTTSCWLLIARWRDLPVHGAEVGCERIAHFESGADNGIGNVLPAIRSAVELSHHLAELGKIDNRRLALVIPATLLLVFLMLFSSFNSVKNALLILLNIPLALVGGIVALWLSAQNLSVPASIGFIALFGIALENGMVLVTYLNQLVRDGVSMAEASIRGACLRLRPVLMTATTTALGLLPLLFSHGTGSEVQRPLATVVIGGLVSSTVLTLLVIPALYKWFAIATASEIRSLERSMADERDQGLYQTPQVIRSDLGAAQSSGVERHERE